MPVDVQLVTAQQTLASLPNSPDVFFYTDCSTREGTTNGGACVVVLIHDAVVLERHAPTRAHSNSFHSERAAFNEALRWLQANDNRASTTTVCDCKSLVEALDNPFPQDSTIRELQQTAALVEAGKILTVTWVPGHCNLRGNELADMQAKRGSVLPQPDATIDTAIRQAVIRRTFQPTPIQHPRLKEVFTKKPDERTEAALSKVDFTDMIRFRSGHHPALRRWQKMAECSDTDQCRLCNEEVESAEHLWLRCPADCGTLYPPTRGYNG
ncbi:p53-induced protein with a death [Octopus vulgaris]|uniref:P53-induced protein with a death n=1 Tax=Octopus vulgaris TaxID=6645 RepID=A0AA36B5G5_OCTVU|nr:p53-induced protein with a death [Octopus vulgaris]